MSRLGAAISSSENVVQGRGCCCPKEEENSAQPRNNPTPANPAACFHVPSQTLVLVPRPGRSDLPKALGPAAAAQPLQSRGK